MSEYGYTTYGGSVYGGIRPPKTVKVGERENAIQYAKREKAIEYRVLD